MSSPVDILEEYFAPHIRLGVEDDAEYSRARAAWRLHLRDHRRSTRISSSTLPAVSLAAQHAIAARDHAQASIDAMGGITTPTEPPEPEKP